MPRSKFTIPSPLSIALILFGFVFSMAVVFFKPEDVTWLDHLAASAKNSYNGMWGVGGLAFLVQMSLMLVLGHILALAKPIQGLITKLLNLAQNQQQAVLITASTTMLAGFINWGFGLIIGAILAKSFADHLVKLGKTVNKPLLAAVGYTGMMVWHGGISGSSLIKIAEPGHLNSLAPTLYNSEDLVDISTTVFGAFNLVTFGLAFMAIIGLALYLSKKFPGKLSSEEKTLSLEKEDGTVLDPGLDNKAWFAWIVGISLGAVALVMSLDANGLSFINPNFINCSLLALAFICHGNVNKFSAALDIAISGTSGILIQFPIYFAIMGIMSGSGMILSIADFFVSISTETSLPIYTFLSAGLINLFVPSGGGQWMIQGPIILESCNNLGIPVQKGILALAYGDQITNMLQPFWALPLLAITKVKAGEMLPYTFKFFLVGLFVYGLCLFFY